MQDYLPLNQIQLAAIVQSAKGIISRIPRGLEKLKCHYTVATSRPADVDGFVVGEKIIRDHLETHAPWRAPDIEIDWVLQASCSICEDGGNVKQECSSVILCSTCGTRWGIDGTYGERWAS